MYISFIYYSKLKFTPPYVHTYGYYITFKDYNVTICGEKLTKHKHRELLMGILKATILCHCSLGWVWWFFNSLALSLDSGGITFSKSGINFYSRFQDP